MVDSHFFFSGFCLCLLSAYVSIRSITFQRPSDSHYFYYSDSLRQKTSCTRVQKVFWLSLRTVRYEALQFRGIQWHRSKINMRWETRSTIASEIYVLCSLQSVIKHITLWDYKLLEIFKQRIILIVLASIRGCCQFR